MKLFDSNLKSTMRFATPMILSQLGQILFGVIDSIMLGHYSPTALAASAFGNYVFGVPMIFLIGFATSISVTVAREYGKSNYEKAGIYFKNGYWTVFLISLVLSVFFLTDTKGFLSLFDQKKSVLDLSTSYFRYLIYSLPFLVAFTSFRNFSDGFSNSIAPMKILGFSLIVNVILNWVFIFGKWGAPEMGIEGAGFGTLLSRIFSLIIIAIYILRASKFSHAKIKLFNKKFEKEKVIEIFKLGTPSGVQYTFEMIAFSGAGVMMGWFGVAPLAAHQIALNVATLTFMVALGTNFALSVKVSQAMGQSNLKLARKTGLQGIFFIAMIMGIAGLFFLLFRKIIPLAYVNDQTIVKLASQFLVVAAAFQVFDGIQAVSVGALRGLSDVKVPTLLTFAAYWLGALPCSYLFAFIFNWGPIGIWFGLALGLFVSSLTLLWRFHKLTLKGLAS